MTKDKADSRVTQAGLAELIAQPWELDDPDILERLREEGMFEALEELEGLQDRFRLFAARLANQAQPTSDVRGWWQHPDLEGHLADAVRDACLNAGVGVVCFDMSKAMARAILSHLRALANSTEQTASIADFEDSFYGFPSTTEQTVADGLVEALAYQLFMDEDAREIAGQKHEASYDYEADQGNVRHYWEAIARAALSRNAPAASGAPTQPAPGMVEALQQIELQSTNIAGDFDKDPWAFVCALHDIVSNALRASNEVAPADGEGA